MDNTEKKIIDSHFMRFIGCDLYQPNPHNIGQVTTQNGTERYRASNPVVEYFINEAYDKFKDGWNRGKKS